jgi:hypothetical protein
MCHCSCLESFDYSAWANILIIFSTAEIREVVKQSTLQKQSSLKLSSMSSINVVTTNSPPNKEVVLEVFSLNDEGFMF